MKLHEAIEQILKNAGRPLSAREIADKINDTKLYTRSGNKPLIPEHILDRIKNYPDWFKTADGLINLSPARYDQFNDAVSSVLENLKNPFLLDVNYLLTTLFFYKRWLDYPEMFRDYGITIETNINNRLSGETFRSFYEQLKKQLENRKKNFDIEVITSLFTSHQDLFKESIGTIESSLKTLDKYTFDKKEYPAEKFGKRFSELFTGSYMNIKKAGEFSTPSSLCELMISLIDSRPDTLFYNPAAGYFTFPAALQRKTGRKILFYGEELNIRIYSLGLLNLIINGCSIENVYLADSITSAGIPDESSDVVICNPPFSAIKDYKKYENHYPFRSRDIILYFLQLAVKKLKPEGEALIVIPESVLFSVSSGFFQLRKYLIENNLVDSVISLPSGAFEPFSMVKTSLLILKKGRRINKILFFDADKKEFFLKDNKGKMALKSSLISERFLQLKNKLKKIPEVYPVFDGSDQVLKEDTADYKSSTNNFVFSTSGDVRKNEFNLVVKRYFLNDLIPLVHEKEPGRLVRLETILKPFRGIKMNSGAAGIPYLSISSLNADITKFTFDNYDQLKIDPKLSGQLADRDILLAGSVESKLKPTFFKFTGRKILLSGDVLAFIPDTEKADLEYLIYELSSDYVNEQVKALSAGVGISRIKLKDFLKIKIELPESIIEQQKLVSAKKEALVQVRIKETGQLAQKLKVSGLQEKKMLGAFKHELTPLASSIKGDIQTINKLLLNKIAENKAPSMSDKVSGADSARTLAELISDMGDSAEKLLRLADSIQQIIDVVRDELKPSETEIKQFIIDQVFQWNHRAEYNIVFHGEEKIAPEVKVTIDREQFVILIRNFLENTHRHGYPDKKENTEIRVKTGPAKNIVFNAFGQEDKIIIEMINDGIPFPEDFTFDNFISFGVRGGAFRGSGIGGFLMNKIIENHNGEFKLIEAGKTLVIPNNFRTAINKDLESRQITAGVYFRIVLPKINIG